MSPRWNWDSSNPSLASECAPPPGTKGDGAHSPAGEGLGPGSPNSDDWRKVSYFVVLPVNDASQVDCSRHLPRHDGHQVPAEHVVYLPPRIIPEF